MGIKCDRRLYLSRDRSRVVEDGDEDAGFLLAAPGRDISAADAAAFGLDYSDGKVILPGSEKSKPADPPQEPPEEPAAELIAEPKSIKKSEDKALKKGADKSARPEREKKS